MDNRNRRETERRCNPLPGSGKGIQRHPTNYNFLDQGVYLRGFPRYRSRTRGLSNRISKSPVREGPPVHVIEGDCCAGGL
jgi:hypothetical protein